MRDHLTITLRWQTGNSSTGTCPALYVAEADYVVQGKTRRDGSVWVDADVLDRLEATLGPAAVSALGTEGQPGYLVHGDRVGPDVVAQLVDCCSDESAVFVVQDDLTPEAR
jgi:hypothetical protein